MSNPVPRSTAAAVGTGLAATLLILYGVMGVAQGIAAIANDQVYAPVGKYAFKFDITAWGWIHLVLGVLLLVAGFAVYTGNVVARAVAVVFALLSVVANFLYVPYQPVWSVSAIGVGLFVIWSLFHNVGPDTG
jgi:hypothetical protein